jgi:beta-aspartyl-peptidase (threonine type)
VAASATGTGEFVIRSLAARSISDDGARRQPAKALADVMGRLGRDFDADVGIIAWIAPGHRSPCIARAHAARPFLRQTKSSRACA